MAMTLLLLLQPRLHVLSFPSRRAVHPQRRGAVAARHGQGTAVLSRACASAAAPNRSGQKDARWRSRRIITTRVTVGIVFVEFFHPVPVSVLNRQSRFRFRFSFQRSVCLTQERVWPTRDRRVTWKTTPCKTRHPLQHRIYGR